MDFLSFSWLSSILDVAGLTAAVATGGIVPFLFASVRALAGAALRSAVSGTSAVLAAAIGAAPSIFQSVMTLPLPAFIFAFLIAGPGGAMYGWNARAHRDAVVVERTQARAIADANKRADAAIAKLRADYDAKLKAALANAKRGGK
ncbi:MAG: hypothetical protein ACR2K1_08870 [Saprospiraceae bacterium]